MRIGIVGPFNPLSIASFLYGDDVPFINEGTTAVNTLAKEFLKQGHYLKIFTLSSIKPNVYQVIKGENVEIHIIPSGLFPSLFGNHMFIIGLYFLSRRISKVINKELEGLDVLHAHWTYEYAKAASCFSDKIPVFDTVRDWCPYQLSIMKGRDKIYWSIKYLIFRQVMSDKNITFIANSGYTYRMLKEAYPSKEMPIIPNPIDKNWILEEKSEQTKHQIISIATGLLSPRKNIGTLLEAFSLYRKKFKDATLHLVGGYDKTDEVYKNWEKRKLTEGVVFYGLLPHNDLAKLLDRMSCLVHPSLEETFGNILLEAMSRRVLCIGGADAGAVPDVLGHGKYGLICDIKNPSAIFYAMEKVLEPKVSGDLQRNATEMLKNIYSSEIIAGKHIELFQRYE